MNGPSRPNSSNQIPGHVLSSFTHYGNVPPKQRIRGNFLASPFEPYHFGNPFAGHLSPSGHFIAKQNFQNSLHMPHPGPGSYQLTSTFIAGPPQKPNPEALRYITNQQFSQNNNNIHHHQQQQHQQQLQNQQLQSPQATQLAEPQPSYLPSLPTVPPSVLSPFFQVQQQKNSNSTPATHSATLQDSPQTQTQDQSPQQESPQTHQDNAGNQFQLLNDEYTVNLVPPPPYKHTESTRFRTRLPVTTTPSTSASSSSFALPTGPPGIGSNGFFDDEQQKALDILTKYNIPAISPLQDANRYAYNSGPFVGLSTAAAPSPSFYDNQVFRVWPNGNNNYSATTFTTEKPNVFRNLVRPTESEYEQHKLMHPSYTSGTRRPIEQSLIPSTTQDTSLNNAITHSFFTIEDAITLSPHLHYRRPVKPTNTNEIEASLKRPTQDDYNTETASMDPFADIVKENAEIVTMASPSSTQQPRPNRNKLRRKRPRPTVDPSSSTSPTQRSRYTPDREPADNGSPTEMPKNHKEFTRDRGTYTQFSRDTTTSESPRESSTGGYRNRVRNRTRLPSTASTTTTEPNDDSHRSKRPNYSAEHRRPNNRFEDTHTQRHRPLAERSTRVPVDESEQTTSTTVANREHSWHYGNASRRPTTTQQAIANSAAPTPTEQEENDEREVETEEYAPSLRIRSSTVSSIPTSQIVIIDTTQGRPEENPIVLSTRLNVSNEPTTYATANEEESETADGTEVQPDDITTQYVQPSSSSSSTTTTTTTSTSSTSSEGPVYIAKTESDPKFNNRKRMRNKDRILEAVAAATSTQTQSTRKATPNRDRGSAQQNEVVTDTDESEPIAIGTGEQETRLKVRLPVYKNSIKSSEDQNTTTKSTRLNASGKFDPKNRPRFSIKEYRQRISTSTTTSTPDSESSSSTAAASATTSSTYTRRFPTRNRLMPSDLKLKTKIQENRIDGDRTNIVYPERPPLDTAESSSEQTEVTRKRFVPKDRYSSRLKTTTTELSGESSTSSTAVPTTESTLSTSTSSKPSIRRGSTRRDFISNRVRYSTSSTTAYPTEATVSRTPIIRNSSFPLRRPQTVSLRQRVQNQKRKELLTIDDSLNDLAVEGSSDDKVSMSTASNEVAASPVASTIGSSTEDYKHETAIMKIAKDDHSYRPYKDKATTTERMNSDSTDDAVVTAVAGSSLADSENDLNDSPSEQSERVAELTIFGTNQFNSVNTSGASRRIPGYFTLATEDPILPIEAFFPQVKRNKREASAKK